MFLLNLPSRRALHNATAAWLSWCAGFLVFLGLRVFQETWWLPIPILLAMLALLGTWRLVRRIQRWNDRRRGQPTLKGDWNWVPVLIAAAGFAGLMPWGIVVLGIGTICTWAATSALVTSIIAVWVIQRAPQESLPPGRVGSVRMILRTGLVVTLLCMFPISSMIVVRNALYIPLRVPWSNSEQPPYERLGAKAPALSALTESLHNADQYLIGLYQPNGLPTQRVNGKDIAVPESEDGTGAGLSTSKYTDANTGATMSEYYAMPIRVRPLDDPRWRLLGDTAVRVKEVNRGATSETSLLSFNLSRGAGTWGDPDRYYPDQERLFNLLVDTDWNYRPGLAHIRIRFVSRLPPNSRIQVAIGDQDLGIWTEADTGREITLALPLSARTLLQSTRYTVRHATIDGYWWMQYHRDPRAQRLLKSVQASGFYNRYDVYAPLWNVASGQPASTVFNARLYRDCYHENPGRTDMHRVYHSKVCRLPLDIYRWMSVTDPLAQSLQALQVAETQGPDIEYRDLDLRKRTPRTAAARLEAQFRNTGGIGLPRCLPLHCDNGWVTSTRTWSFGALETVLGYEQGDPISRTYADQLARIALRMQIPTVAYNRGAITAYRQRYFRPANAGGFYTLWTTQWVGGTEPTPKAAATDWLLKRLDMPTEYESIIPANAETVLAAYAFLKRYRCARYNVGCQQATEPLPQTPAVKIQKNVHTETDRFIQFRNIDPLYAHSYNSTNQDSTKKTCARSQRYVVDQIILRMHYMPQGCSEWFTATGQRKHPPVNPLDYRWDANKR